ncbi:hypothetical protein X946_4118 [Burkholderia sp. ABCPW 111]|nr:hypothetical protein X946_4118 [Burkholderia sp. ABCPW 111]
MKRSARRQRCATARGIAFANAVCHAANRAGNGNA